MKFLIPIIAAFSLTSCALLDSTSIKYNDDIQYIVSKTNSSVKLVATSILYLSKDQVDKDKKKLIMNNLADRIDSFNLPTHPTPEIVIENIIAVLPDKTHWKFLATNIAENYEVFLTENEKVTVDIVSLFFAEVSKALREVSSR
jgi:hypothetical protein